MNISNNNLNHPAQNTICPQCLIKQNIGAEVVFGIKFNPVMKEYRLFLSGLKLPMFGGLIGRAFIDFLRFIVRPIRRAMVFVSDIAKARAEILSKAKEWGSNR